MKAFVLAGGFATRLWPLTESRAKPLLPLAGKPMLSYIVESIPADVSVTVSTNAAFEQSFQEWKQTLNRSNVTIAIEQTTHEDQKLGTNGAFAQWINVNNIDEDVLLVTGDNYLGFSMQKFIDAFTPDHPLLAAYDIKDLTQASKFGNVIADGKHVTGFEEKPKNPKSTLVSTGCYLIPASCLKTVIGYAQSHPDHIGGIFEEFLKREIPVDCFRFDESWFDIGSFESYVEATRALVGEQVIRGQGSEIRESDTEGSVVLGENCTVIKSTLRDTVLFRNCIIEDCILERCVIDDGCVLKGVDLTGKMLRAGTTLIRK
jgi:glucose-1-phosphate thymidylyltransferase